MVRVWRLALPVWALLGVGAGVRVTRRREETLGLSKEAQPDAAQGNQDEHLIEEALASDADSLAHSQRETEHSLGFSGRPKKGRKGGKGFAHHGHHGQWSDRAKVLEAVRKDGAKLGHAGKKT